MKKLILFLILLLMIVPTTAKAGDDDGFKFWGLSEQSFDSESALIGRLGYQIGSVEPFIGTSWVPKQNTETGEIDPPNLITLGGLVHLPDLIDPNAPLFGLQEVLLEFIPKNFESKPYFGWQGSWAIVDDDAGGFHGGVLGLKNKLSPDDEAEWTVEAQYNNFFADLNGLRDDDEFTIYFGLRIGF